MRLVPALLALTLAVAGCQGPSPVTPPADVPVQPAAAPSSAAEPASPTAPPAATPAGDLTGRAATFRGPFAHAAVTVTLLGETAAIATATTDAEGRFALALPATVEAGALLKISAAQDGRTLRTIAPARGERHVQADDETALNDATSLAVLMLDDRFDAAGQASRDAQGRTDPQTASDTLSTFDTLTDACGRALDGTSDAARGTATTADGEADLDASLRGSSGLHGAFGTGANMLDGIIRNGVGRGGTPPSAGLLGPASFGGSTTNGISLGGSSGGGSGPRSGAEGSLDVQDGQLSHEGAEGSQIVD